MANTKVHVVATLKAKPGQEEKVRGMLLGLLEPSRRDKGCLRYELFQARDTPTTFVFLEEWADDASLQTHLASPLIQNGAAQLMPLLTAPPDIVPYRPVG